MTSAEEIFARWGHRKWYFRYVNWLHQVTYWKKRERRETFRLLDLLSPKKILDFGCYDGFFASTIKEHTGAEIYATDINLHALEQASRTYPCVNFIPPEVADTMRAEFDVILLSHVLEHVDSCDEIIGAISRLLAPNGKLIIIVPQERVRGDVIPHQIFFYSAKQRRFLNPHVRIIRRGTLEKLLGEHGLVVEDYVYINFLPPLVSRGYYWLHAFSLITTCSRRID